MCHTQRCVYSASPAFQLGSSVTYAYLCLYCDHDRGFLVAPREACYEGME